MKSLISPGLRTLALLLAVLAGSALLHPASAAVLYDLTFDLPHIVGFPAVQGAGPAPRVVVSPSVEPSPDVVASFGALTDRPLELSAVDTGSPFDDEEFTLRLDDLPQAELYTIDVDVLVTSGQLDGSLVLLIDAPATRRIDFQADGEIRAWASGGNEVLVGTYTLGQVVHLRVDVDLEADTWTIWLNGIRTADLDFESATAIETVRMGTDVSALGPSIEGAIDNLVITIPDDGPCDRVRFNDLTLGDTWNVGESFVSDDVRVDVTPFYYTPGPCGGSSANGFTRVIGTALACGGGKEMNVNNVTLDFDFHGPVTDVLIRYGEYGGTQSLGVNGDCEVVTRMADLDGTVLGGVAVSVFDLDPTQEGCGVIRLGGTVDQLSIGGQEFYVDQISYCPACGEVARSAFEDQTMGTQFRAGDSFTSGQATHTLRRFAPAGADCSVTVGNGVATIDSGDAACQDGLELGLASISDQIDFGREIQWLALAYGDYVNGNVNLRINGDCRNAANLADLSGELIGGVFVWAVDYTTPGLGCGTLYAVGNIREFTIGGQSLWIDNIRTCPNAAAGIGGESSPVPPEAVASAVTNAPNPFRSGTMIRFALAQRAPVAISIHDVSGRLVRSLAAGSFDRGTQQVWWDGRTERGDRAPSGLYLYRVEAAGQTGGGRMIMLP